MFFRWCGGCGSKKSGLMNMLEAQNTLVSILNPTVLTCSSTAIHSCNDENKSLYLSRGLLLAGSERPESSDHGSDVYRDRQKASRFCMPLLGTLEPVCELARPMVPNLTSVPSLSADCTLDVGARRLTKLFKAHSIFFLRREHPRASG